MSNTEPNLERSARRHSPAIWGIVVSLVAVAIIVLFVAPWRTQDDDVARQADAETLSTAEGTTTTAVEPIAPAAPETAPAN